MERGGGGKGMGQGRKEEGGGGQGRKEGTKEGW